MANTKIDKEQVELVKTILVHKNIDYEEWLNEQHFNYIKKNVSYIKNNLKEPKENIKV